jgi:hypothetical protein
MPNPEHVGEDSNPSLSEQEPQPSSSSWPGVRMVTVTAWVSTRAQFFHRQRIVDPCFCECGDSHRMTWAMSVSVSPEKELEPGEANALSV